VIAFLSSFIKIVVMKPCHISLSKAFLLLSLVLEISAVNCFATGNLLSLERSHSTNTIKTQNTVDKAVQGLLLRRNKFSILQAVPSGGDGSIARKKPAPKCPLHPANLLKFADKNFFVLGMAVAVWVAQKFPKLGMDQGILQPEIFIGKFGVMCIFLLSGLSLELSELREAVNNHKLNGLIQLSSFILWPLLFGLPLFKLLETFSIFTPALRDGLLILSSLPTTVNMCVLLTSAAGGSVASALCNAVMGNTLGIFATPALLLRFFGTSISLPFGKMVGKLSSKVLAPVLVGQVLRQTPAKEIYKRHSKKFKRFQEIILLGIVWNAFSNAFAKGLGVDFGMSTGISLFATLVGLVLSSLFVLFNFFKLPQLGFKPEEVIAATFCASHKTLAFGLPLIKTVFDGNPNLASYCAPIMMIHPLQLILGSLLVPEFAWYASQSDKDKST